MAAVAVRPESTAVVEQHDESRGITQLLEHENARKRIEPFLPRGVDYDRVVAAAYLAWKKNEDLHKCTGESIVLAVSRIVSWDLEIGETAHLVRFGNEATAIADYKGLIELVIRSGAVRSVDAHEVYEGDHFEYKLGLEQKLDHVPAPVAKRGKLAYAYAIFRLPFNNVRLEVMPIEDIDAIRKAKSRQWKNGDCPPWYAIKTVIRRGVKQLPKNPRLAKALATIDAEEQFEIEGDGAPVAMIDAPRSAPLPEPAHIGPNSRPLANQSAEDPYGQNPPTAPAAPGPREVPVRTAAPVATDPAILTYHLSQRDPMAPSEAAVAAARAFRNPFRNSPSFGKPLGEFTIDGLESLVQWIGTKRKESGNPTLHADVHDAARVIIYDAELQQTSLPLAEAPVAAAPTSSTLTPGRVGDALPRNPGTEPAEVVPDPAIGPLLEQLQHIASDTAMAEADRKSIERTIASGTLQTVEQVEKEIDRARRLLELPF